MMLFGSYQLSIGWELLNYIGNQNPVCICMSRHTSIPSSPVLIFYLNFVCVATLVPRLLFSVSDYIGNFLMKAEVTEFV